MRVSRKWEMAVMRVDFETLLDLTWMVCCCCCCWVFLFHFVVLRAGDTQESPSILRHTDSSYKPVLVFHHLPNFVGFWCRCFVFFPLCLWASYPCRQPGQKKTDGSTSRNPIAHCGLHIIERRGELYKKQLCSRNNWPWRDPTTLFSLSIWFDHLLFGGVGVWIG